MVTKPKKKRVHSSQRGQQQAKVAPYEAVADSKDQQADYRDSGGKGIISILRNRNRSELPHDHDHHTKLILLCPRPTTPSNQEELLLKRQQGGKALVSAGPARKDEAQQKSSPMFSTLPLTTTTKPMRKAQRKAMQTKTPWMKKVNQSPTYDYRRAQAAGFFLTIDRHLPLQHQMKARSPLPKSPRPLPSLVLPAKEKCKKLLGFMLPLVTMKTKTRRGPEVKEMEVISLIRSAKLMKQHSGAILVSTPRTNILVLYPTPTYTQEMVLLVLTRKNRSKWKSKPKA
jgi:hypothetical protein